MYDNRSERGGMPNIDEVEMIKLLVLQQWHGLSNPEFDKQAADRLSFRKFLGFPEDVTDFTLSLYGISESDWRRPVKTERSGRNSSDNRTLFV